MKKKLFYLWLGALILSLVISLVPKGLDAELLGALPVIFVIFILIPFISSILLILIQNKNKSYQFLPNFLVGAIAVSYTHLRAHETVLDLVCRLLLEKKNKPQTTHLLI